MTDEMQRPTDVGRPFPVYREEAAMATVETATVKGTTAYTGLPGTFTAYKVVCGDEPDPNVWCSLAASGDGRVIYRVGEPAKAPGWLAVEGYHLIAFDTLMRAARYWRGLELQMCYAVFECEALYQEPLPPRVPPWGVSKRGRLTPFAALYQGWPPGTVMVQRLTRLHRIADEVLRGY
jgi:hypothetical protein